MQEMKARKWALIFLRKSCKKCLTFLCYDAKMVEPH